MPPERGGKPPAPLIRAPGRRKVLQPAPSGSVLESDRLSVAMRADVSRETLRRLDVFVALLIEWQRKTNLVAPSTMPMLWSRHIADSLAFARFCDPAMAWADLGSGGGFPGLVLAIHRADAASQPAPLVLIESNDKKAAFLRAVIRETGVEARVEASRVEDCGSLLRLSDGISARALAPLDALLALVYGRIRPEIPCYFAKGRQYAEEVIDASLHWRFRMNPHTDGVEPGSAILEIRDIEPSTGG